MVRAWVASPLARERGRVRVASRQPRRLLDKSNPSPSSSPLLRGERRPPEPVLIFIDLQMMSLAAKRNILVSSAGASVRFGSEILLPRRRDQNDTDDMAYGF